MSLTSLLRGLTPPFLARAASRMFDPGTTYSGPYDSWATAVRAATGYAAPEILDRVVSATSAALQGRVAYEQDGVEFPDPAPSTPVLSGLLLGAALNSEEFSVLDYGGSLGSHYLKWRSRFDALPSLRWDIVEQATFIAAGERLYQGSGLPIHFHASVAEAGVSRPSVALLGSVLQYLESPFDVVREIVARAPKVIIIDRTPLTAGDRDPILVQHVASNIYSGSYPLRTLGRPMMKSILESRYDLLEEFDNSSPPVRLHSFTAPYVGMIWLRRDRHEG